MVHGLTSLYMQEMETYINFHQNTVTQYIVKRPIMDLCLTVARRPGARVSKWRWEQEGLDLAGDTGGGASGIGGEGLRVVEGRG